MGSVNEDASAFLVNVVEVTVAAVGTVGGRVADATRVGATSHGVSGLKIVAVAFRRADERGDMRAAGVVI